MIRGTERGTGDAELHVRVVPRAAEFGEVDSKAGAGTAGGSEVAGSAVSFGGRVEGGGFHGGDIDARGTAADGGGWEGAGARFDFEADGAGFGVVDCEDRAGDGESEKGG